MSPVVPTLQAGSLLMCHRGIAGHKPAVRGPPPDSEDWIYGSLDNSQLPLTTTPRLLSAPGHHWAGTSQLPRPRGRVTESPFCPTLTLHRNWDLSARNTTTREFHLFALLTKETVDQMVKGTDTWCLLVITRYVQILKWHASDGQTQLSVTHVLSDPRCESKREKTGDGKLNLPSGCTHWTAGHCHRLPVLGLVSENDCAAAVEVNQRTASCSVFVTGWWILLEGRVQVAGERPRTARHTSHHRLFTCQVWPTTLTVGFQSTLNSCYSGRFSDETTRGPSARGRRQRCKDAFLEHGCTICKARQRRCLSPTPPSWKGLLGHIGTVQAGRPTKVQGHVLYCPLRLSLCFWPTPSKSWSVEFFTWINLSLKRFFKWF